MKRLLVAIGFAPPAVPAAGRERRGSWRVALAAVVVLLALGVGSIAWWRTENATGSGTVGRETRVDPSALVKPEQAPPPVERPRSSAPLPPPAPSSAEKAERVEKIKRDYDEIRAKAAADYSAAGAAFPGGLNAFLRQLALLEREKRADFAAELDAAELEELEFRETAAGQLVQRLLSDTAATEEQRREVFRLQLAFDDRFALTFDLTPGALLERETARQHLQARIREVLGDVVFAAWLRGEGGDFGNFTRFVAEQGLPGARAFDLWQVKNDFIRKRLELGAQRLPAEQLRTLQAALTRETQGRVVGILGPGATQIASREVLGWLPPK